MWRCYNNLISKEVAGSLWCHYIYMYLKKKYIYIYMNIYIYIYIYIYATVPPAPVE